MPKKSSLHEASLFDEAWTWHFSAIKKAQGEQKSSMGSVIFMLLFSYYHLLILSLEVASAFAFCFCSFNLSARSSPTRCVSFKAASFFKSANRFAGLPKNLMIHSFSFTFKLYFSIPLLEHLYSKQAALHFLLLNLQ